ncbi:eL24 family ribosomal protein [Lachnotalea glycerini]|uniref:hypothetical protein n=1 Tax=Lachnotalea glycerini TaxID=1763509 RepID=UPI0011B44516|nr:hypothetical protein [Lachnotalea glycerini]
MTLSEITAGAKEWLDTLALEKNVSEQISKGKACLYCGKEIEQPATGRPKKFCSETCRRRWWRVHQTI